MSKTFSPLRISFLGTLALGLMLAAGCKSNIAPGTFHVELANDSRVLARDIRMEYGEQYATVETLAPGESYGPIIFNASDDDAFLVNYVDEYGNQRTKEMKLTMQPTFRGKGEFRVVENGRMDARAQVRVEYDR
ncbi:MAG: hypothetical protein RLY93_03835 [Sumerlaeia bacterium]